jgi:hypothetical protein
MYAQSGIIINTEISDSARMKVFAKIVQMWHEHKKKQLLKSFDEVEPGVFVLKQEIIDRVKIKVGKSKINQIKKLNNK